jgi:uncharacterized membrane protein YhaH (DUF805 family)
MNMMTLLFGFRGGIERVPFVVGLAGVGVVFIAGLRGAEAALPWMAQVLAPRGINAGLALNVIWSALWVGAVWAALALIAKRLRAVGRSPWWGPAGILPFVALAQINDAIFLVSRSIVLPSALEGVIIIAAGAITLWIVQETAVRLGRSQN